jgi:hypothetical protein
LVSINAFALDDRSLFMPLSNHCSESALAWCEIDESLEFSLTHQEKITLKLLFILNF